MSLQEKQITTLTPTPQQWFRDSAQGERQPIRIENFGTLLEETDYLEQTTKFKSKDARENNGEVSSKQLREGW